LSTLIIPSPIKNIDNNPEISIITTKTKKIIQNLFY
jgi:hypothetical protein